MAHHFQVGSVYELPFPDSSIDTIVTDPPWHFQLRIPKGKAAAASPYALIDDSEWCGGDTALSFTGSAIVAVPKPTPLTEMYRVLKPGGHLYVFAPERKLSMVLNQFTTALGETSNDTYSPEDHFEHFNTVIWVKVRKDGRDLRMGLGHTYRAAYEAIVCLSKGKRRNLQTRSVPNVLFAPPLGGSRKPPSIYSALVRASTAPGGLVLDPFAGSDPLGRADLVEYETRSLDLVSLEDTKLVKG